MAQFNLTWFNTAVIIDANVTGQTVSHRQKSVGGSYSSVGYTPSNTLPKTASAAQSPVLANNVIWEFKVEAICTVGGPTINDNGVQEGFKFACIEPSISNITSTSATITLNVLGLDISHAVLTLLKTTDDTIVAGPTSVSKIGNSITWNVTGLTAATQYYVSSVLYATVGGVQVNSTPCTSLDFDTLAGSCAPVTDLDVTSIAINV